MNFEMKSDEKKTEKKQLSKRSRRTRFTDVSTKLHSNDEYTMHGNRDKGDRCIRHTMRISLLVRHSFLFVTLVESFFHIVYSLLLLLLRFVDLIEKLS